MFILALLSYTTTSNAGTRRDVKLKLGIGKMPLTSNAPLLSLVKYYDAHLVNSLSGFGAAGFSILVMGIIFFLYHRRNKKRYGSSSFMSRNISSHPASITDLEKAGTYLGVHIFSYNELEKATNKFDSKRELGDGGFGTVYKGMLTLYISQLLIYSSILDINPLASFFLYFFLWYIFTRKSPRWSSCCSKTLIRKQLQKGRSVHE